MRPKPHSLWILLLAFLGACSNEVPTDGNQPPVVSITEPMDGAVLPSEKSITLVGSAFDDQDGPEELSVQWNSNLSGDLGTSQIDEDNTTALKLDALVAGEHTISLTVVDSDGLAGAATVAFVVNAPPGSPQVMIDPEEPGTADDLNVTLIGDLKDPNRRQDALTLTYSWYRGAELQEDQVEPTLPSSLTAKGELWQVRVVANDGHVDGPEGTSQVTIKNTIPSCSESLISPVAGDTNTDFHCSCVDRDDPDEDLVADSCTFLNGTEELITVDTVDGSCLLPAALTTRGMEISCVLTPGDDEATGDAVASTIVSVKNSLPTVVGVSLQPDPAWVCTSFTCSVDEVLDPDEDTTQVLIRWTRNGDELDHEGANLTVEDIVLGDVFQCFVSATDGTSDGPDLVYGVETASASVTVGNEPPQIETVAVEPADATVGTTLDCVPQGFMDPDCGVEPAYTFSWFVDDALVEDATEATFDSAGLAPTTLVSCGATPSDGIQDGEELFSLPLSLKNNPPIPPVVSVEAPEGANGSVTCTILEPAVDDEQLTTTYLWTINGEQAFEGPQTLEANQLSHCDVVTCQIKVFDGFLAAQSNLSETALPFGADCDDLNPCTDNACAQGGGCASQDNLALCDDENLCTTGDGCFAGVCTGIEIDPSDGVDCTVDTCSPSVGPVNSPNNDACATNQLCITDICDPQTGCETEPTPNCCGNGDVELGEGCDDGNDALEPCDYGLESCSVCSPDCELVQGAARFCGDGNVDILEGEGCDDGNAALFDGCAPDCTLHCAPGFGLDGDACVPCSEGTVSPGGLDPCVTCAPGSEPSQNQGSCAPCVAGTTSPDGLNCVACPDCVPCQGCPDDDLSGVTPINLLTGEGPAPEVDEVTPIPVTIDRGFVCHDDGVGSELTIAEVDGAVGDRLVLVSTGDCFFDLVYRTGSGDLPLSAAPGGYILAVAERFTESDVTLICASDVAHIPGTNEANERLVQSVVIRCWARAGVAPFVALPDAVVPEGAEDGDSSGYAAWIDNLTVEDGTYRLGWIRDFSFQFLNMSDSGRPATDGRYKTSLSFDGQNLTPGESVLESESVLGTAPASGEWTPSPEEKAMANGLFNITDGDCQDGCIP